MSDGFSLIFDIVSGLLMVLPNLYILFVIPVRIKELKSETLERQKILEKELREIKEILKGKTIQM